MRTLTRATVFDLATLAAVCPLLGRRPDARFDSFKARLEGILKKNLLLRSTRSIRLSALAIGIAGLAGASAALQAAPITYTGVSIGATGGNGTSSVQVTNGAVIFSGAASGGTATGGGSASASFANASTLTQNSSGAASLGLGSLSATANSFQWSGALTPPNGTGGVSTSRAEFRETVSFINATAANLLLPFAWTVEGDIPAGSGGSYKYAFSSIQLFKSNSNTTGNTLLQGSTSTTLADSYAFGYVDGNTSFSQPVGDGAWFTGTVPAPIGSKLMATLVVSPGQSDIDILALLDLDCRGGWNCNFGNTAKFSFDPLPYGLSFTSASGVFLTTPIPEPETWTMLVVGLGLVGFAARRRVRKSGDVR
jgi:hypothetical protein